MTKLDLIFVMDTSGSINQNAFLKTKQALKQVVNILKIGPHEMRVGFGTFHTHLNIQFHLDMFNTSNDINMAIMGIQNSQGATAIHTALRQTHEEMIKTKLRPGATTIVCLLADGKSTIGGSPRKRRAKDIAEANKIKRENHILICVGISSGVDKRTLTQMATSPELALFTDYNKLGHDIKKLIDLVVNCHFD